jgi:hypothetical protein
MRMLMKAQLPADSGYAPAAARLDAMRTVLEALKPEAVYFYPEHGVRTTLVMFDMKSPSDMPSIAEPLFKQGARVEFSPVMNLEDLKQGVQRIQS